MLIIKALNTHIYIYTQLPTALNLLLPFYTHMYIYIAACLVYLYYFLFEQGLENSGILQNAGEGLERNGFSRKLNHKPWPLPVLNMLSNNWNSISVVQQQQQRKCKICQKTDTPLWRKGPDGPKVSSFIISPFLLHIYCNNNVSSLRHCANINI